MSLLRITGGPRPSRFKIVDLTSGADISNTVRGFSMSVDASDGGLARVKLDVLAEVDLTLEEVEGDES